MAAGLGGTVAAAVGVGLGAGATVAALGGEGVGVGPVVGEGVVGKGVVTPGAGNVDVGDGCAAAVATEVAIAGAGLEAFSDPVHPIIIAASVHSKASMRDRLKVFPLVPCPRLSQPNKGPAIPAFPHTAL